MVRPQYNQEEQPSREERLRNFGLSLGYNLKKHNVIKSKFAKDCGLTPSDITQMLNGDPNRLTESYFLRFLTGLVLYDICAEEWEAEEWLEDFYNAKGREHRIPLKDLKVKELNGKVIIQLIKDKQATSEQTSLLEKQQALERPKYHTKQELPLISSDHDIQKILNKLREENIHFLTLVGLPGWEKNDFGQQVKIQAQKQMYFSCIYLCSYSVNDDETSPSSLEWVIPSEVVIWSLTDDLGKMTTQERKRVLFIIFNCENIKDLAKAIYDFLDEHQNVTILEIRIASPDIWDMNSNFF